MNEMKRYLRDYKSWMYCTPLLLHIMWSKHHAELTTNYFPSNKLLLSLVITLLYIARGKRCGHISVSLIKDIWLIKSNFVMDSNFAFNGCLQREKRIKIHCVLTLWWKKCKTKRKKMELHIFSHPIFNISSFLSLPQLIGDMEEF